MSVITIDGNKVWALPACCHDLFDKKFCFLGIMGPTVGRDLHGDGHTQVVCVCAHMHIALIILTSNKNPCHSELNFPRLLGAHALLQEENRHGDSEVESRMNHAMNWGSTR